MVPDPPGGGYKIMDDTLRKQLTRRIASASGHLKGIERMVEEDTYCVDVIRQIQAVQAALTKVSTMLLDNHLQTCVTEAVRGDDLAERETMLQELTAVFITQNKL